MSHQDRKSQQQIVVNHESLREVVSWLLSPALFVGMHVRKGSKWKPRMLAATALFWATSDRTTLTDRFEHTRKIIKRIFQRQQEPGRTYRGFMKMLGKWHTQILFCVVGELRSRMQQELQEQFLIAGFMVFAADGSRVATPRTKSNQQAYSARQKKKRKTKKKSKRGQSQAACQKKTPAAKRRKMKKQSAAAIEKRTITTQIWLTLLWHVGTGLPYGFAVVLAERCRGFERTPAPAGDAERDAGKLFNDSRCGLCGVRLLEGGPQCRA